MGEVTANRLEVAQQRVVVMVQIDVGRIVLPRVTALYVNVNLLMRHLHGAESGSHQVSRMTSEMAAGGAPTRGVSARFKAALSWETRSVNCSSESIWEAMWVVLNQNRVNGQQPIGDFSESLVPVWIGLGCARHGVRQVVTVPSTSKLWESQLVKNAGVGDILVKRPPPKLGVMHRTFTQARERKQDRMETFAKAIGAERKITQVGPYRRRKQADVTAAKRLQRFFEHPGKTVQTNRTTVTSNQEGAGLQVGDAWFVHHKVLREGLARGLIEQQKPLNCDPQGRVGRG